ncbi:hypothetical protein [Heterosigma akashiwo virus 01]|uniref:Uncharacterized protein n=1 Tax=Heterosigma akashiwo virus 01 TaxID=97195 RepID=A0A1C9C5G2_HAV01|nr:hypothetical protein D1R72_gp185 [Heterosigma akashiwo virus 01]AOM63516.1 hypothetical protein [Heterosigma akashiwo virus 01]
MASDNTRQCMSQSKFSVSYKNLNVFETTFVQLPYLHMVCTLVALDILSVSWYSETKFNSCSLQKFLSSSSVNLCTPLIFLSTSLILYSEYINFHIQMRK